MERFVNELVTKLYGKVDEKDLVIIREALYKTMDNYEISFRETGLSTYQGEVPREVKEFIVAKKIEGLSDGTLKTYYYTLRQFFDYIRKGALDITTNDIRQFLYAQSQQGLKDITLDGHRLVLNSFYEWLVLNDYIIRNPCKKLKSIRGEKIIKEPLTDIEMEKVRNACRTLAEKAIVELLYSTGCRVSELVGMKVNNFNISSREIKVYGKGKKERITYANARAIIAVNNYLMSKDYVSEYVFTSQRKPHQPLTARRIEIIIKKLGIRAGIPSRVYPHKIRRTTATDALTRGMTLEQVQSLLGHESPRTTLIYAKISQSDVKTSHQKAIV